MSDPYRLKHKIKCPNCKTQIKEQPGDRIACPKCNNIFTLIDTIMILLDELWSENKKMKREMVKIKVYKELYEKLMEDQNERI
jgi:uncharacterized protein YbaR (Trm112 family)